MTHSPFPGMDPFIEARGLWHDFHDKLIGEIERTLAPILPARYVVRLAERTYVDWIDIEEESRDTRYVKPDVRIVEARRGLTGGETSDLAVAELVDASVAMHPIVQVEEREIFIEIRDVEEDERLVTSVEVLSPTNKRPGTPGWHEYERKRQLFFQGEANFVEIDLLRGGKRRPMAEPWPDSPYYLLVLWKEETPLCHVWAAYSTQPLHKIPIPLLPPDSNVVLELQPLVDSVYARSRYIPRLRYHEPIDPPLSAEEAALLANHLKQGS